MLRLGGKVRAAVSWWWLSAFPRADFAESVGPSSWRRWRPFEISDSSRLWLRGFPLKHLNEMGHLCPGLAFDASMAHHPRVVGVCLSDGRTQYSIGALWSSPDQSRFWNGRSSTGNRSWDWRVQLVRIVHSGAMSNWSGASRDTGQITVVHINNAAHSTNYPLYLLLHSTSLLPLISAIRPSYFLFLLQLSALYKIRPRRFGWCNSLPLCLRRWHLLHVRVRVPQLSLQYLLLFSLAHRLRGDVHTLFITVDGYFFVCWKLIQDRPLPLLEKEAGFFRTLGDCTFHQVCHGLGPRGNRRRGRGWGISRSLARVGQWPLTISFQLIAGWI